MFGLSKLKLIAIALGLIFAVSAIGTVGWKLGVAQVKDSEQARADEQIQGVKNTYEQLLMKQQQLTDTYRSLSDNEYAELSKKLGNIRITNTTVTNNITKEREDNPAFYKQQVPAGGQKEWDAARNLFR